jgi:hypothetical protein
VTSQHLRDPTGLLNMFRLDDIAPCFISILTLLLAQEVERIDYNSNPLKFSAPLGSWTFSPIIPTYRFFEVDTVRDGAFVAMLMFVFCESR